MISNRSTPLQGMNVSIHTSYYISADEVDKVFWKRLADLQEGIFIRGDKVYQTLGIHPHNGDDVDEEIGLLKEVKKDPRWMIALACLYLRRAIMEAAV
jgi:hypothetical protein